jgi:selenocysteine lyase/cysteine desulfurase
MPLSSQKHLFQLPDNIHYLNCAYMSPLLKSVEQAGITGMQQKRDPSKISSADFFKEIGDIQHKFGQLVNCSPEQVALIPSASYGLAAAVNNIEASPEKHAITVEDEFPSGVYALHDWQRRTGAGLVTIKRPLGSSCVGSIWTDTLLEAINAQTALVLISSVHWTDGTIFDLPRIGARCKEVGALFVVDGTQSVGAMPIDVEKAHIDALVCACYKWMMGPYSSGLAYFSPFFNQGIPLENSWMTRSNAYDFTRLIHYTADYTAGAGRYNVGEFSNFILSPMINAALTQLLEWDPARIQSYGKSLSAPLIDYLAANQYELEDAAWRSGHLFGIKVPSTLDTRRLLEVFKSKHIYLSLRGQALRVSVNVFNTEADMNALMEALEDI